MSEELEHLYTTTELNAGFLEEILKDNNIAVLIKNEFSSGLSAGFGGGSQENAAQLYVNKEDIEKAKSLLDEFLNSSQSE